MDYGHVPGIDRPISRLVQGTVMLRENDLPAAFALLDAVVEQGGNAFDAARHYAGGTEATLGRWIRERGLRDRVVIVGKGAHPDRTGNRVNPAAIATDLEESLRQLGVESIDLYLLHRDDPDVPVGPIVEALNEHQRAGKIRAFGGSNWSAARIAAANAYARERGLTPFAASSPQFSLAEQIEEPWPDCRSIGGPSGAAERAWYQQAGMPLFVWSSLAGGFFSGAFGRDRDGALPAESAARARRSYGSDANYERLDRARTLAAERGLLVPQVALAFVLAQPLEIFPLVGCETGAEFAVNAAAIEVRLTPDEVDWLDLRRDAR